MVLGAVASCMDSSSGHTVPERHQPPQYQQQFQLLQPLQLLQEQLLLPTVRSVESASLLDQDATVEPENIRRLLVLGASNVGKTAIVQRFLGQSVSDKYIPTVEDFHRKVYRISGRVYRLDIVDTSGILHPFPAIRRLSLSLGDLFLLVYSIDNRRSFTEMKHIREELLQVKLDDWTSRGLLPSELAVPIVVVGNKSDKDDERQVALAQLNEYASGSCCNEMSARTNVNVNETFIQLLTVAGLPAKMCPSQHRELQATSSVTGRSSMFRRRTDNAACGAIISNVLRPDVQSELVQQQRRLNCADVERPQPNRVVIAKCCKCELL